jgi:hypothetical protein
LFVVAKTKEPGPTYVQRLHALDVATGAERAGSPIVISGQVTGSGTGNVGGQIIFDSLAHMQRPALAIANGIVYVALGSHGDHNTWHGWVFGYDKTTLANMALYCTSPDADSSAIWQGGNGIAVDANGDLYVESGNGPFDGNTAGGRDLGDSVIKLDAHGALLDYFTPSIQDTLNSGDIDLGSAGSVVLPDQTGAHPHLVLSTGKPGVMYLIDRDAMTKFNATDQIVQEVDVNPNTTGITSGIFATPAYWNGHIYVAGVMDPLKSFTLSAGRLSTTPVSVSALSYDYPGAGPTVSASGTTGGIIWVVMGDGYSPSNPAVLHAYDALDLTNELYNASQAAGSRDQAGPANKFVVPTVANGKVYVATQTEVTVYGLLP